MIQLTQIGQRLLAEMLGRSPAVMQALVQAAWSSTPARIPTELRAVADLQLTACGKFGFDGAHKINVAILAPTIHDCLAVETRLGLDRLGQRDFDKRFLQPCTGSHKNSRVAGSMIAILERKLPDPDERHAVQTEHAGETYRVRPRWALVVRQRTLDDWQAHGRLALSENCVPLSFESLVAALGGRDPFNALVADLLPRDYYAAWIETD